MGVVSVIPDPSSCPKETGYASEREIEGEVIEPVNLLN